MFYFSQIAGKSVKDQEGQHIGKVWDMVVSPGESFPRISAVIEYSRAGYKIIPWDKVKHIDHEGVIINSRHQSLESFEPNGELLLQRDILDKQIVDINGHRVVRVNDIQLNRVGEDLRLAGVDVGTPGLFRRMGFLDFADAISRMLRLRTPTNIIPWDTVQTLESSDSPLRLATTHQKLTRLHPADLADILEELSAVQRENLFRTLDTEKAAEILEYMEDEAQLALFKSLPDEVASDILEEMSPDEAADLLQDLPEDRARDLIDMMEPEEARDIRILFRYREDTAGGLMSTDFITGSPDMTCSQMIEKIREIAPAMEMSYYVYVVDETKKLLGVVSLRDLIVNEPQKKLEDIMRKDLWYVSANEEAKELIELVTKYDLLAVPVLDEEKTIKGIVTFDDVMDLLNPDE